jgi:hypothetical protein
MVDKVLQVPSVFDGDSIMPSITITHIRGKVGTEYTVPEVSSLTVIGAQDNPNNLATVFLEFVSINGATYTEEEHRALAHLIVSIHQRHRRPLE